MPIPGVVQPAFLSVTDSVRLRKFDGVCDFALDWYQDPQTVYLVDGVRTPYTQDRLLAMYRFLDRAGELYFIEIRENGAWLPIGDVTFWQQDLPIAIGIPAYRGRGIGRAVLATLLSRGRSLGYTELFVNEIYHWNTASRRCFESLGFRAYEATETGARYVYRALP